MSVKKPRREVHRDSESRPALVDLRGGYLRLLEHEFGELADSVVLLGGGDELGRGDRALLGVGPAGERFGANDLPRYDVELGLVGDPHLARSIASSSWLSIDSFHDASCSIRGRDIPLEALVGRLVRSHEAAGKSVSERASASD